MKKLLNLALIAAAIATPLASQAAPEEFNEGHLQGAVNVPHDQIASQIARISPDKKAPVNLYCRSGRRAEAALEELKKLGYTNVTNHGGYQDLINKGIQ